MIWVSADPSMMEVMADHWLSTHFATVRATFATAIACSMSTFSKLAACHTGLPLLPSSSHSPHSRDSCELFGGFIPPTANALRADKVQALTNVEFFCTDNKVCYNTMIAPELEREYYRLQRQLQLSPFGLSYIMLTHSLFFCFTSSPHSTLPLPLTCLSHFPPHLH